MRLDFSWNYTIFFSFLFSCLHPSLTSKTLPVFWKPLVPPIPHPINKSQETWIAESASAHQMHSHLSLALCCLKQECLLKIRNLLWFMKIDFFDSGWKCTKDNVLYLHHMLHLLSLWNILLIFKWKLLLAIFLVWKREKRHIFYTVSFIALSYIHQS